MGENTGSHTSPALRLAQPGLTATRTSMQQATCYLLKAFSFSYHMEGCPRDQVSEIPEVSPGARLQALPCYPPVYDAGWGLSLVPAQNTLSQCTNVPSRSHALVVHQTRAKVGDSGHSSTSPSWAPSTAMTQSAFPSTASITAEDPTD